VQSSSRKIYRVLGETVRIRRKKARLSQEQLAEKADLTRNYIGDIERAEKKITLETLAEIAKALKCRVRDLIWEI
jgi:transcriptional regulator with XRE-family HTH domain